LAAAFTIFFLSEWYIAVFQDTCSPEGGYHNFKGTASSLTFKTEVTLHIES
jgi:hypothetical protein